MKYNNAVLGLLIGLALPLLGMVLVFLIWFPGMSFDVFLNRLFSEGRIAAKVITLSNIVNVVPFILFTNKKKDLSGRGILIATMLYFVLVILLKFVW